MLGYLASDSIPSHYVIVFQNLDEEYISMITKHYNLHPILNTECANSSLNTKDCFLPFEDYFLLTLSNSDINDNVENPVSMKMLVFNKQIVIFTNGPMNSIDLVFD